MMNLENIKNNIEKSFTGVEVINPGESFSKLYISFEKTPTLEEVCGILKIAEADEFPIFLFNGVEEENLEGDRLMNSISRTSKIYNAAIFHGTTDYLDENYYTGKKLYDSWKLNGARDEKVLIKNADMQSELNGTHYADVITIQYKKLNARNKVIF